MAPREYRCADYGGESGIDQDLTAHDDEVAVELGIALGTEDSIAFLPSALGELLRTDGAVKGWFFR